jgi:methionyl aminopeptidase
MTIESEKDVEGLLKVGKIVSQCLRHLIQKAEPGMTTLELDTIAGEFLNLYGARSAPKLTYNFPGHTCISLNSVIAHGVPSSQQVLSFGDLVNIDVSAEHEGYFADMGGSFGLGQLTPKKQRIVEATRNARDTAISQITNGASFKVVGKAVENIARKEGFAVLRDLQSHGVGRALHEEPKFIPSHLDKGERRSFKKGMVLTIEPFLTTSPKFTDLRNDGWSLLLPKGHFGAQFEHTLIVTDGAPIVTTF